MLPVNRSVGQLIAYYRNLQGLSRHDLAEISGVNYKHLCNIEAGVKGTRIPTLVRLAVALGITLEALFDTDKDWTKIVD